MCADQWEDTQIGTVHEEDTPRGDVQVEDTHRGALPMKKRTLTLKATR